MVQFIPQERLPRAKEVVDVPVPLSPEQIFEVVQFEPAGVEWGRVERVGKQIADMTVSPFSGRVVEQIVSLQVQVLERFVEQIVAVPQILEHSVEVIKGFSAGALFSTHRGADCRLARATSHGVCGGAVTTGGCSRCSVNSAP